MNYRYDGPLSGVTLRGAADEAPREVMLFPGAVVDLPPENPWVQSLVHRRLLVAVPEEPAPAAEASAPNRKAAKKEKE